MNADIEFHIKQRYPWSRLPANVRQQLGNSQEEYEKCVVSFSVRNQLRHKGNLVRTSMRDDKRYYEALMTYSREHLMLFPYHLSNVIVKGMRSTPFQYYVAMMQDLMMQEKSYDSLPNFTAADCLRLLGIGRNQYIDLMNKCRSSKQRFFRRRPVKEILPSQPVPDLIIEPWWLIQVGYVTEDDMKTVTDEEKRSVDAIIDNGPQKAGDLPFGAVHSLYLKGLVYVDVPIVDNDCIIVPPLEGFVMNRVLGDYLETLLYKIFVSIDEHTSVVELANILQIDAELVKNAVSVYCRLGFAIKKAREFDPTTAHSTWEHYKKQSPRRNQDREGVLLLNWNSTSVDRSLHSDQWNAVQKSPDSSSSEELDISEATSVGHSKRIAFLFDSTLTAFLMMGNLSPGLKSHAVTMFEVGKLPDESLDSLLAELDKIADVGEGEAQRYFDHALTLHSTVRFLRNNRELAVDLDAPLGLDLIRCESLQSLEEATCARLLHKNYSLLVSMAPLSNEIRPVTSSMPHLGPTIPEVNSIWFKLFIYQATGHGPPTLLISKGSRMRCLPKILQSFERLLVTTWGHDPGVVPTSNALFTLNDALTHSAVLVQGYGRRYDGETVFVPFPFNSRDIESAEIISDMLQHPAIQKLAAVLDLEHFCGYVTMVRFAGKEPWRRCTDAPSVEDQPAGDVVESMTSGSDVSSTDYSRDGIRNKRAAEILISELDKLAPLHNSTDESECSDNCDGWTLLDCYFGLPLFDCELNKDISRRISQHNLCKPDSLKALTHSSRILTIQLLEFISNIQDSTIFADGKFETLLTTKKPSDGDITSPCKNLIFDGDKLEVWNGR